MAVLASPNGRYINNGRYIKAEDHAAMAVLSTRSRKLPKRPSAFLAKRPSGPALIKRQLVHKAAIGFDKLALFKRALIKQQCPAVDKLLVRRNIGSALQS